MKLQNLVNKMPTMHTSLYTKKKVNGKEQLDFCDAGEYPISDHEVMLCQTPMGTFATWNMLNPNSRTGPTFSRIYNEYGHCLVSPEEKRLHIIKVCEHIIELFKAGVDFISLQEVPLKSGDNFKLMKESLQIAAQVAGISLDLDAFENSFRANEEPRYTKEKAGYHDFGTAVLFRSGFCTIESQSDILNERGTKFTINISSSDSKLNLINHHGDYINSLTAANFLANELKQANTIVCSDSNIPVSNLTVETVGELPQLSETLEVIKQLPGLANEVLPNSSEVRRHKITLDFMLSNLPNSKFIGKTGLANYAHNPNGSNSPRLFARSTLVQPGTEILSSSSSHHA